MTTEFEVLQHRRRQVRLWPLDPRWRSSWARGSAQAWNEAKKRHPVGSVTSATVTGVFPANQEYVIRFSDDKDDQPWSGATLRILICDNFPARLQGTPSARQAVRP
jgi:hypothetical protein